MRVLLLVLIAALIGGSESHGAANILKSPEKGELKLQGIDVIRFAPQGVLLIADGKGGKIIAVDTEDSSPLPGTGAKIADLTTQLSGKLGVKPTEVEILDLAVNPASHKAYLAVRKQDEPRDLIVTVDPSGKIELFPLDKTSHVSITLPKADPATPALRITDVAWAGDRLVCAAQAKEEFASKLLVVPGPLGKDSTASIFSAETYHVAHGKWETKAPMSSILPYEENGRWYVVGAFSCTPIVKYPLDSLTAGAKVKGISMLELGSGNRPLNMFTYDKAGQQSVLVNTFRFHHERSPVGPNPYWTCRFNRELLADQQKVNELAVRRDTKNPNDPAVTVADAFHGTVHMDRLDDKTALVVRVTPEKKFDLEPVVLP